MREMGFAGSRFKGSRFKVEGVVADKNCNIFERDSLFLQKSFEV